MKAARHPHKILDIYNKLYMLADGSKEGESLTGRPMKGLWKHTETEHTYSSDDGEGNGTHVQICVIGKY